MLFFSNRTLVVTLIVTALLGVLGCSAAPDEQALQQFVEAQKLFEKAETLSEAEQKETFQRSALMFQGLVDRGIRSGPVYYNLGNAWARCDERGRALAAYHSAQRYMPLDPHLASNLQTVQGRALSAPPSTPLVEYLFFWQDWFGVRQKALFATASALLASLCGFLCCFIRHRRMRRLAWTSLALTVIACLSTGYDWYRFEWTRHAVVAVEEARPRKGHSEQYETAFTASVTLGTTAEVLDRRGDWVYLRFGPGRDAWLPAKEVVEY